jgi:hypothetical protein
MSELEKKKRKQRTTRYSVEAIQRLEAYHPHRPAYNDPHANFEKIRTMRGPK